MKHAIYISQVQNIFKLICKMVYLMFPGTNYINSTHHTPEMILMTITSRCARDFLKKKKIFFRDIKNHCGAKIDEIWNMPYIFRKFKIFSSSYAKWFTWCFRAPITSIQHITRLKWFLWPLLHDVPEIFWKKKNFLET